MADINDIHSKLDSIDSSLGTANLLNGANLVANVVNAANTHRLAVAVEEQNARARAAAEKAARIQSLRDSLFEAERALTSINNESAQATYLETLVRLLEVRTLLQEDGALATNAYERIEDKRYADSVSRMLESMIAQVQTQAPTKVKELKMWNATLNYRAYLQRYIVIEQLLAKPLGLDNEYKSSIIKKTALWGALILIVSGLFGWKLVVALMLCYAGALYYLIKKWMPFSHSQRSAVDPGYRQIIPEGILSAEKLQKERKIRMELLQEIDHNQEAAIERLKCLNSWAEQTSKLDRAYARKGSSVIIQYPGPVEVPNL